MQITITIPKLTAIRARWKWGLLVVLALPLIAVLAMVMFFAWGQPSDQAEAAGPAPGMALKAPASVEVGSKFTIIISGNPVPTKGSPGFGGFAAEVQVSAGLKYSGIEDCTSELKATVQDGDPPSFCKSFAISGNHAIAVLSGFSSPLVEMDASGPNKELANFSYQCNTIGTKTITLIASAALGLDGTEYAAPDLSEIAVKTKVDGNADQITVYCAPPKAEININPAQKDPGPSPFGCYNVLDDVKAFLFTVCDNDAQAGFPQTQPSAGLCDADGTVECEDSDPTKGKIRVSVVSGNYNVVESKPPPNYDPTNTAQQPCATAPGAKCEVIFNNDTVTVPWFPEDVNGDGQVALGDFLRVLQVFGQPKPQ